MEDRDPGKMEGGPGPCASLGRPPERASQGQYREGDQPVSRGLETRVSDWVARVPRAEDQRRGLKTGNLRNLQNTQSTDHLCTPERGWPQRKTMWKA